MRGGPLWPSVPVRFPTATVHWTPEACARRTRTGRRPIRELNPGESPRTRLERIGWDVDTNGCWVFRGPQRRWGYTCVYISGRGTLAAHRVSYEVFVGPIPDGLILMHGCDNPPCINPDHLTPGTNHDNTQDMIAKGRAVWGSGPAGSYHPAAKLTADEVLEIRHLASCGVARRVLAERFGVKRGQIGKIITRLQWQDI